MTPIDILMPDSCARARDYIPAVEKAIPGYLKLFMVNNKVSVLIGFLAFLWYWGIAGIIACMNGVGLSRRGSEFISSISGSDWFMSFSSQAVSVPAFWDFVHFAFSALVLLIGVPVGIGTLRLSVKVLPVLAGDSGISIGSQAYDSCLDKLRKRLTRPSLVLVMFYLLVVFVAVFGPLAWVSLKIDHARRLAIRRLEEIYTEATVHLSDNDASLSSVPDVESLILVIQSYENHPLTPFAGRTFSILVGSYVLQIATAIYGVM